MRSRWLKVFGVLLALGLIAAACGDSDDDDSGGDGGATTTAAEEGGASTTAAEEGGAATTAAEGGEGGEAVGADFTLFGAPTGVEGDAMAGFIDVYNEATDSSIEYTGSNEFEAQLRIRVEGGDPPAVAFTPQPASICEFADQGALTSLEDMGFDIAEMEANHSKFWMDLGLCADGQHYGIPWFPNFKSIVFYHVPTFEENGYEIPETFEDLVALSQQMVDDGLTPWCFGFESGGATGWPGTDWIEDIYVRQAGADMYAQWFKHEIPFNDPSVVEAFDTFGEIFFGENFVLGGTDGVAGINVDDTPGPMFQDPPGCVMMKQGSFIANVFADQPEFEEGEDQEIGVFPFPSIGGNSGAMGGGDTLIVFDSAPENVQAVKDWITPEWQCTLASASGGGIAEHGGHGVAGVERLPGHKDVDPACYESEAAQTFAATITDALANNLFVFDASDLMPAAVGQGSFWTAMIDWSRGSESQSVADEVESSWPAG
jgi:alpha-glucoside transport system substrate-binding protein